ncbi:hypothetical protein DH2020_040917 [Rehmannia glutinosa]|uniref:Heptahelical transmembrane protein n=1 Tax=Rehmannia glutinosa TaxID=99300 RepID=A0ABR0URM9_REHGL
MGKNQGDCDVAKSFVGSDDDQAVGSPSREGKGKRLWNKVKYQLVEYHSLPGYLKDNEYILGHYRAEWPLKQTLLSVFTIHNETLNVWTHLIGFFLFLSLTIYTAMKVPNVVDLHRLQNFPDVLRKADFQKLHTELITCLPSLPHMPDLQRLREELKTSLHSMDLLPYLSNWHIMELLSNCIPESLSPQLCLSSFMTVLAEMFELKPIFKTLPLELLLVERNFFFFFFFFMTGNPQSLLLLFGSTMRELLPSSQHPSTHPSTTPSCAIHSSAISTWVSSLYLELGQSWYPFSRISKPEYRNFRASLFFGMGFSGAAPILHKLILFWHQPEALHTTAYEVLMGLFYGIGALVYAMRIPERWMPGKFDIAGHSHQLFHVLVVAGAYTHYQAGLVYLRWRDLQGC